MKNSLTRSYLRILLIIFLGLFTTQLSLAQMCPNVTPALGVSTGGQNIVCELPGTIEFMISGYEDISSNFGANYYISYGDGKFVGSVDISGVPFYYQTHLTNDQLKNQGGKIKYTYDQSYCGTGNTKWEIQVRVVGCDPDLTQIGSTSMLLQQAGTADFTAIPQCDYTVCLNNLSQDFINFKCEPTYLYTWDFGDGTTRNQIIEPAPVEMSFCHEYSCAGSYEITLYSYSGYEMVEENGEYVYVGSKCGSDNLTQEVMILPKPELKKKSNINICAKEKVEEVKLQDLDVCTYDWYNKTTKKCEKKDVCTLLGKKVANSFQYIISGDDVGLELGTYYKEGEDAIIPEFEAINTSEAAKKVKICVIPYNELGCAGEEMCYEITVNPSAGLSNIKDYAFCKDSEAKLNAFQSNVSGVTYDWKVKDGDWAAIGLPLSSGSGNMPTFTAKNETTSPITVIIEVQVNASVCKGSVEEFKITVYPLPEYNISSQSPTTCNGTDGFIEFKNLNLNVTQYKVSYKKDGELVEKDYPVNSGIVKVTGLSKGNYTEIKIAASGSECYVATADITLEDPAIPNVPIISSNSPICIGENLELTVDNADADINSWKWTGPACSGTTFSSTSKEPAPMPMQYCLAGDYTLEVERNKCYSSATITVTYKEDPEVTLQPLSSVCIGDFTIDDEVVYSWKTIPTDKQVANWELLDNSNNVLDTKTALYPTFNVATAGDYKVRVTVDGFGCNGTKLVAEQSIKVKEVNYTLDVLADKSQICANDDVSFTNNTTKNEEINYKWTVSPETGVVYAGGTSTTSDAPVITFGTPGKYSVTVQSDNGCTARTQTFNVNVRSNPTVVLNTLPDGCKGETFSDIDQYVTYTWNNVEGETPLWSVTPSDGGVEILDTNSNFPTLKYTKNGDYTIRVDMPDISCGTQGFAESALKIYDGSFTVDIEQDETIICEAEQVNFTNNTVYADPVEYVWSVSPTNGVIISDISSPTPSITFNEYGTFTISVLVDGVCHDETETFEVRVNRDPKITFSTFETICNNNEFTIDNTKVTYQWYNMLDSEKEIEWTVTPNTGVTANNTDKENPTFTFSLVGDYVIKVKVKGTGCNQTYVEETVNVSVISDDLELKVVESAKDGCVPLDIIFDNTTSDTDEITYTWKVEAAEEESADWEFKQGSETSKSPVITFNAENSYKVLLEAENKCNTKSLSFNIDAYDEVHFALSQIPIVCGEYTFDSKSEKEGLIVTGDVDNIKSINWVVYKSTDNTNSNFQIATTDVYEFKSGDANTLYPIIWIKDVGYYKIELQAQTICNDETVSTTVEIEKPITITLTQPEPLCANIADDFGLNPYTLQVEPTDGSWSWAEEMPIEKQTYLDSNTNTFYPNEPGTYKLKYSVQRQVCYAEKTMEVVVKEYPFLEIGNDIYVCEKDLTPILLEGNPSNGVWAGNEVSKDGNNYYFNPPLTVGDYEVSYTIIDEFGCKNRGYKQGHIQPLPNPDFGPQAHCLPEAITFQPVVDVATHKFELDYGDETKGTDLSHLYTEIGEYNVKLIVTDPSGCVDSLTKVLLVEKYPDQELIVSEKMGCSPFTPEIKLEYEYSDSNVEFLWDFGLFGKQYTEQPDPVTFIAQGRDTTYQYSITVKNHCGEHTVTDTVRVLASPKAIIIPNIAYGCSPLLVDFKNTSLGSIHEMNYTWDFGDGTPREYEFRATHTFTTGYKNDSTYQVMLIAENHCGADTTYQEIYVIPPVVYPQIVNPTPVVCVGDNICIHDETMEVIPHHEIITYKWNFGNGKVTDNPYDSCAVYDLPGKYKIELNITTSCGSSESDYAEVEVLESPRFEITVPDYICNLDSVKPKILLLSNIREVTWNFGNGDSITKIDPIYSYKEHGEYVITATATEDNFASCKASKSVPFLVRALPDPDIEPLDVDSCSPYTYEPLISEDLYFAIDYENNGIKDSNNKHVYVNTGFEPIIYQTTIYLEDKYGCKSEKNGVINIYPEPIASIAITDVLEERPEVVTFLSTSIGADVCRWRLPFAGGLETCQEVKESFYENKTETIYLEVANMYNCVDKDSIDYTPMMKGLYFPNTFSPNGVLAEVRTFNGVGLGLVSYQLEIFDLYGNLIFRTTSLDENGTPNEGWDGRDKYGNLMPQDVYSWKAEAVYLDGTHYPFGNDVDNAEGTEVNDVTVHRGSVLLLHR